MGKRRRRRGKGKVRRRLIGKSRKEVDNKVERRQKDYNRRRGRNGKRNGRREMGRRQ